MTIMNERQALKLVCKKLRQKGTPIGSIDRPFMDEFFAGRTPTSTEINHLRTGVERGAERNLLYVVHSEHGSIMKVDTYDCSKAEQPEEAVEEPSKEKLSNIQLLLSLCDLIGDLSNDDNVVVTKNTKPVLLSDLHAKISEEYDITYEQVEHAFAAMYYLNIRGDSAKLRRQGMEFDPSELMALMRANCAEEVEMANNSIAVLETQNAALKEENERLQGIDESQRRRLQTTSEEIEYILSENENLSNQNTSISAENERLIQANDDLRTRNTALAKLERAVRTGVEEYDENR